MPRKENWARGSRRSLVLCIDAVSIRRGPQGCRSTDISPFVAWLQLFVDIDQLDEVFDSEVGEGHDAVVAEAKDADHAVFCVHCIGDLIKPFDAFAELLGDAVDGRDVIDLVDVHGQAASAGAP